MNLIPFSRDELKDWGVKLKDIERIYFVSYMLILIFIFLGILLFLVNLL